MSTAKVYVWDIFVRIFHWTLVSCIFLNFFITDEGDEIHEIIGYIAGAFVLSRFLWGFIGSPYARFSAWVVGPRRVLAYAKNWLHRKPYLSHNPLAGWMMLFLMGCVLVLAVSGFMMGTDRFFGEEWVEEFHEITANMMMAGVAGHVLGVISESLHEKQNLVKSMISGYKRKP